MSPDLFNELESKLYEYGKLSKIGMYFSIFFFIALIVDFYFRDVEYYSLGFEAFLLGLSVASWAIGFDKKDKYSKRLNSYCRTMYRKEYRFCGEEISDLKK